MAAKQPRKPASTLNRDRDQAGNAPQPITPETGGLTDVIRKMEREAKAAREAEADELNDRVEATLMRSIDIQASNNKAAKRQNMKELKAMRDELRMAGKRGEDTKEYEALFDKLIKGSVESTGIATKVVSDLQSNVLGRIPTLDSIIGLAGASNPMIGLGLKILSSASRNMSEAKRAADAERSKRLDNVKSEAEATALKLKQLKQQREDKLKPANDPGVDRGDGRDSNGKFIKDAQGVSLKQLDVLIGIYERLGGTEEQLKASVQEQRNAARLAAKARSESMVDDLQGLEEKKEKKPLLLPAANDPNGGKKKGFLANVAGEAIGNVIGRLIPSILGGLTTGLVALGGIFSKGGKLLKVAGKASGILTIVMAVFDFFDGFSKAGEMLGVKDPTFIDRVFMGFVGIWKGLVGIVDSITGMLGFKTDFAGMTEKFLVGVYKDYYMPVINFIGDTASKMTGWATDAGAAVATFFDEKKKALASMWDAVTEFDVGEFLGSVKEGFKKKVEDMFTFVKDSIEDLLVTGIGSLVDILPEFARTQGMNDLVKRKNDLQTRKEAEKQQTFPAQYDTTAKAIQDDKDRKEAEAKAATAVVQQNNNTNVNNNTTIGQPKISVGNPDQTAGAGHTTFGS